MGGSFADIMPLLEQISPGMAKGGVFLKSPLESKILENPYS